MISEIVILSTYFFSTMYPEIVLLNEITSSRERLNEILKTIPYFNKFTEEMNEYLEQEEDVLSYALFPNVALDFFKLRRAKKYGIESEFTDFENNVTMI